MPIRIRKLPNKARWRVYEGKDIKAKSTSKTKARAQARFLRGLEHGMRPRKRK